MTVTSAMRYTFLRDNLYLDFAGALVGADGAIRGPAGTGRAAMVARADVGRVATAVLQDLDAHLDRVYELTGPESLTLTEEAGILSVAGERSVHFVDPTVEEAYASGGEYAAPRWQLEAGVSTHTAIASGVLEHVGDDVDAITGRPQRSVAGLLAGDR